MQKEKKPEDSLVTMTEMVLPNDTNPLNNLMGGRLMHLIDIAGAIAAQKHSNRIVVTASVDNISFEAPIKIGSVVTLKAKVTRAFTSSMEVMVRVESEDIPTGKKRFTNQAYLTFVAVDQNGTPIAVPRLMPETEEEKKRYEDALQRRQMRLILAGRIKPEDAPELKSIFVQ
jgi:acyl-CoA hydrolase